MSMNTLEQLQTLLVEDLHALRELQQRGWFTWPMSRVVKEEHLGRCCYLAEEFLSTSDLLALKRQLGLNERQWRYFKKKVSG